MGSVMGEMLRSAGLRAGSVSATEATVLRALAGGERSGQGLVGPAGAGLKRGTVYVTLGRMEAKGLIVSRREPRPPTEGGRPLRLYALSEEGGRVVAMLAGMGAVSGR